MAKRPITLILLSALGFGGVGLLALALPRLVEAWCVAALARGGSQEASMAAEVLPWVFSQGSVARLLEPMRGMPIQDGRSEPEGHHRLARAVLDQGRRAMPGLLAALKDDDDGPLRERAVWLLAETCKGAPAALEALSGLLRDPSAEVRLMSLGVLARRHVVAGCGLIPRPVFEDTSSALGAITAALDDGDPRVRAQAAMALAAMEGRARHALPALIERLHDSEVEVLSSVLWALRAVAGECPDAAREPVVEFLEHADPWLVISAAETLEPKEAGAAFERVRELCREPEAPWWRSAIWCAARLARRDGQFLQILREIEQGPDARAAGEARREFEFYASLACDDP